MRQIRLTILTYSTIFSFALAFAEEGITQFELNQKHGLAAAHAEKQMKDVLTQISKEYSDDPVFLEKLRDAQKTWELFLEKELQAIYPPRELGYYGSMLPMCEADWRTKLIQKRTEELRRWLDHSGGGCSESMEHIILEGGPQPGVPADGNSGRR